ncbi:hypothetical protein M408DRAFT_28653 [Serendipita vermifera MAFF 305830]|uniref:Uncharacterized protein n=1 Tax=Serendipita vermifera MAFF 305830 TaxID=933852 RepID=A0A0C3AD03_SERVB|nr:hypothetical protein M408DRAFT_28653 [Serendipita vermifera MAFF 305830]
MTTTIIVDDSDLSSTIYSEGWTVAGVSDAKSLEYNSTVHIGASNGLELTFRFSGHRVSVYGTVVAPLSNGLPTSTYTIDGAPLTATNFTGGNLATIPDLQSHLLFYESPTLQEGQHNLTITLSNITNGSPAYYLDFFTVEMFTPNGMSQVIVDDSDAAVIYTGNWTEGHAFNDFLGTDHKSSNLGNANVTFEFNGTSISAFGSFATANDPASLLDFYIDSTHASRYEAPQAGNILRNVPFFSKSGLSPGPHTLLIKSNPSAPWWLDYLIYFQSDAATSSSPPTNGDGNQGSSGGSSPPVGAIAGGVVGGVVLLLGLAALWYFRRRKQQTQVLSVATVSETQQYRGSATIGTTGLTPNEKAFPPSTPGTATFGTNSQHNSSSVPGRPATIPAPAHSASSDVGSHGLQPQREVDGGVRLASGDEDDESYVPEILPPSYARY